MADCTKTTEQIVSELAAGPKAVTGDQGSWTNHSLRDLMDYEDRQAAKKAGKGLIRGIYVGRYTLPGGNGT